jgi:NAD-dependent deacetylase
MAIPPMPPVWTVAREAALDDQKDRSRGWRQSALHGVWRLLKAAVISFGQQMPEKKWNGRWTHASPCDLFLVLGSSLVVHPAAQLPVDRSRAAVQTW